MDGKKKDHCDKNAKGERRRVVDRSEGKSDSFFNIRLAGDVFLHSSMPVCVYFPVAVRDTAPGIPQLSTDYSNIKAWWTDEEGVQRHTP